MRLSRLVTMTVSSLALAAGSVVAVGAASPASATTTTASPQVAQTIASHPTAQKAVRISDDDWGDRDWGDWGDRGDWGGDWD
jgi:hypothetical protein